MPSVLVYSIVYISLLAGFNYARKQYNIRGIKPINNWFLWTCIIFVSVFVGCRWMVGVDYPNYLEVIQYGTRSYELDRFEPIPKLLVLVVEWFNLPFCVWFIAMAFLQLLGILIIVNRRYVFLMVWIILLFLTYFFEPSLNIIRQVTACIYALGACTYIYERKILPFLLMSCIAAMFHSSAFIIIPFYLIANIDWFRHRWVQYILICVCCVFGNYAVNYLSDILLSHYEELKYVDYLNRDLTIEQGSGIGVLLTYVRYMILVYYSNELKQKYSKVGFTVFYNLTFIDMCTYSSIVSNQMISRAVMYFTMADIMASAFLIHYLLIKKNNTLSRIAATIIILILCIVSAHNACNGEPWKFV